jgi:tripartite-type tricarboxylate transporter receptor subunit TctC
VIRRLNADVQKALAAPDVIETMAKLGLEPGGGTPQQYAAMIVDDLAQWRAAVKAAGIKLE